MPIQTNPPIDREAQALAACYRLLLQKAQERRQRLAQEQATVKEVETAESESTEDK